MLMSPRLSRFVLTSHITFSVGWLGAVAVFLVLAITGLTSQNIQLARSLFLAMEISSWYVIVPFCFAALVTGIIQSVGTKWGLFRQYWITVKLILTLGATFLLLLHLQPISTLAGIAAGPDFSGLQMPGLKMQVVADAGASFLLLIGIITISIYKPWGKIKYSWKKDQVDPKQIFRTGNKKSAGFYIMLGLIALILVFIIMHLFGGGMRH